MASKQFYDLVIAELTLMKLVRQLDENCNRFGPYNTKSLVEDLTDRALDTSGMKVDPKELDETLEKFIVERKLLDS
jgi:hypothetical protein